MVQKSNFLILLEPTAMKNVKQNYLTCVCERE